MTTASSFHTSEPIHSPTELTTYFTRGAKPAAAFRVGVEQEKLGVRADGSPVPYDGDKGIAALLGRLEQRGFKALREDGHIIALSRAGDQITVEPGGQFELSAGAVRTAALARQQLDAHVREVGAVAAELDIQFIQGGFRPFGTLDEVSWLPKRRYAVMRSYLPTRGTLGHEMMKRTATVQANFDYADEADAMARLRLGMAATSIVTALFAASPITNGRPNGYKTARAAVWLDTDEDRCGLLPFAFDAEPRFADYVEWALDVPLFFVVRDGNYHPAPGFTFRRFLTEGWRDQRATLEDWEIHLSTLFPEVRLKTYVEVRGADAGPLLFARALAALWRGLLDDGEARAAAWRLLVGPSYEERLQLRREVPKLGLAARYGTKGPALQTLAVELVALAAEGLRRLPEGAADSDLLAPLAAYAAEGRCPADDMLEDWNRLGGDPAKLVAAWKLEAS